MIKKDAAAVIAGEQLSGLEEAIAIMQQEKRQMASTHE